MRQRTVLALVFVAFLAGLSGCSAAGSLSLNPVNDSELAEQASYDLGAADDPRESAEARVVRAAIENGSVTHNASHDVTGKGVTYRYAGRFYRVSSTVVGQVSGYESAVEIDFDPGTVDGRSVAYEDLPAVDRRALDPLLDGPRRNRTAGPDLGASAFYTDREAADSVLVPEQRYAGVVYEGETYRIGVEGVRDGALDTYRYEPRLVAESGAAFAANLTDRYAFTLSGLSDAERDVVESALNDTYYAENSDDEAFASVVERFRAHRPVSEDGSYGNWIVRYEGKRYWVDLEYGGFVTDTDPDVTPPSVTPPPE